MNRINTAIFDFDGTLADTSTGIIKTLRATLDALGLPSTSDEQIKSAIGVPLAGTLRIGGNVPEEMIEEGMVIYRKLFLTVALPSIKLFDGVHDTILQLKEQGMKLAIATSRGYDSLKFITDNTGIGNCFDEIATVNGDYRPKPAPDMVLYLLDRLGSKADETIVVGDTTFDLDMGNSAGCTTCGVSYGNHSREKLSESNPNYIIDNFRELTKVLL